MTRRRTRRRRLPHREPLPPPGIKMQCPREGTPSGGHEMMKQLAAIAATAALALSGPALAQAPNDAQIAHIAYTAGQIDVAAARQALARSHDRQVRAFAQTMVRDHEAVNRQAVALVTRLHVTPAANPTSTAL